jgi:hypothetical protein
VVAARVGLPVVQGGRLMAAPPFRVEQDVNNPGFWRLYRRYPISRRQLIGTFASIGEAIDYAYKHWPWWP